MTSLPQVGGPGPANCGATLSHWNGSAWTDEPIDVLVTGIAASSTHMFVVGDRGAVLSRPR